MQVQSEAQRLKDDIQFWNCRRCNIKLKEDQNDNVHKV